MIIFIKAELTLDFYRLLCLNSRIIRFFFSYKKYNKTLKKHFKIPIQNLIKGTDIIWYFIYYKFNL